MDYEQAKTFAVPFGKYRGRSLETLLRTDPSYLIWLKDCQLMKNWTGPFRLALNAFVAETSVKNSLAHANEDKKWARAMWR